MSFFRKKRFRIILAVIAVVFALYWLLVNLLVSAALAPSFMRRPESFERIPKKSAKWYSEVTRANGFEE